MVEFTGEEITELSFARKRSNNVELVEGVEALALLKRLLNQLFLAFFCELLWLFDVEEAFTLFEAAREASGTSDVATFSVE